MVCNHSPTHDSPFPRVSFVLFSIDSIEGRKDSREGKERWREWNTSNAFIFQGRNLCMTPPRWMPHAEMGSVPIVERYRFKNVAATIHEIPFVSELDEEDRASNKGDLLQERRRSRNSSRETLSLSWRIAKKTNHAPSTSLSFP